jgi:hypothetical protein
VISDEELSDYNFDFGLSPSDVHEFFVINRNLEPFGISTANMAWKAFIRSYIMNNMITVEYQQTGSAFNSIGSPYHLNDSKMFSITDQIAIGRLLYLSGLYRLTNDNLMGYNTETNTHNNIQVQSILRLPHLPYLKAAFDSNSSENSENGDIESGAFIPYSGNSNQVSLGIGYNFIQIPYVPTQIDLSYRTGVNSRETGATDLRAIETLSDNKNNGFNLSLSNRFLPIPLKTLISYSSATNTNELSEKEYKNSRFYFRGEYSFLNEMLKPYLAFSTTSLSGDQDKQSYSVSSLGLQAYPLPKLSISTDLALKSHGNKADSDKEYSTTTWRLTVSQRF